MESQLIASIKSKLPLIESEYTAAVEAWWQEPVYLPFYSEDEGLTILGNDSTGLVVGQMGGYNVTDLSNFVTCF